MFRQLLFPLIGSVYLLTAGLLVGQTGSPPVPPIPPPVPAKATVDTPPARDLVAASVQGQVIPELAVYRGLLGVPPARREAVRKDVLNFLIDNTIVDQYLVQLKIQIEPKEIEENVEKIKAQAVKDKLDWTEQLKKLHISEAELRSELTSAIRWDKFVLQQGTDKALRDLFEKNKEMFDGSRMKARHILIAAADGNKDQALATATTIKKAIDAEAGQAVAKLPPTADAITREKTRVGALDKAFAEAAMKKSTCPSKEDGGDLGYFPRAGAMVEPFARAAFALKPYQMSEPVATEFGYHLILAVDAKPGKEVKFEEVKPFVQEVYGERLREAILTHYRPKTKVEIFAPKK